MGVCYSLLQASLYGKFVDVYINGNYVGEIKKEMLTDKLHGHKNVMWIP